MKVGDSFEIAFKVKTLKLHEFLQKRKTKTEPINDNIKIHDDVKLRNKKSNNLLQI